MKFLNCKIGEYQEPVRSGHSASSAKKTQSNIGVKFNSNALVASEEAALKDLKRLGEDPSKGVRDKYIEAKAIINRFTQPYKNMKLTDSQHHDVSAALGRLSSSLQGHPLYIDSRIMTDEDLTKKGKTVDLAFHGFLNNYFSDYIKNINSQSFDKKIEMLDGMIDDFRSERTESTFTKSGKENINERLMTFHKQKLEAIMTELIKLAHENPSEKKTSLVSRYSNAMLGSLEYLRKNGGISSEVRNKWDQIVSVMASKESQQSTAMEQLNMFGTMVKASN